MGLLLLQHRWMYLLGCMLLHREVLTRLLLLSVVLMLLHRKLPHGRLLDSGLLWL